MDPVTQALILANALVHLEELYVEGLTADQRAARSTRLYDLITFVLDKADKAHAFFHGQNDSTSAAPAA